MFIYTNVHTLIAFLLVRMDSACAENDDEFSNLLASYDIIHSCDALREYLFYHSQFRYQYRLLTARFMTIFVALIQGRKAIQSMSKRVLRANPSHS